MSMYDDALEATAPTPQGYGFPANPSTVNKQCWVRQEAFLAAYSELGTILHAARVAGIHRDTVNKWISADLYSFKKRMEYAHQDYREFIEGLIHERLVNPQGNCGSDVLLMFKEKAEWPEKYREEVKVIGVDASKQMMDKLRELAMKERERAALGPGEGTAVEAVYREVSGPGHEPAVNPPPRAERADVSSRVPGPPQPIPREMTPPDKQPAEGKSQTLGVSGPNKPGRYRSRGKPGRQVNRR
jgi:hypothetical protein